MDRNFVEQQLQSIEAQVVRGVRDLALQTELVRALEMQGEVIGATIARDSLFDLEKDQKAREAKRDRLERELIEMNQNGGESG